MGNLLVSDGRRGCFAPLVCAMLISHRKQFIFTKTIKTAGTSVEAYFERYCVPDDQMKEAHFRPAVVSGAGVIGHRGPKSILDHWYEHLPAAKIKAEVGPEIWQRYFKFTTIRDPFDKMVSAYFFYKQQARVAPIKMRLKSRLRKMLGRQMYPDSLSRMLWIEGETDLERFRKWVISGGDLDDRRIFTIEGQVCVDYFIRFEQLFEGIAEVCARINVPYEPDRLPNFKSGLRSKTIPLADFYDDELIEWVSREYKWELDEFGYRPPSHS